MKPGLPHRVLGVETDEIAGQVELESRGVELDHRLVAPATAAGDGEELDRRPRAQYAAGHGEAMQRAVDLDLADAIAAVAEIDDLGLRRLLHVGRHEGADSEEEHAASQRVAHGGRPVPS